MTKKIIQASERLVSKARQCEKQSDWQSAITFYRSALKLRPNYVEVHHNLAIALRHDGQGERALTSARAAAKIAPEHPTVHFSLGVSLEQMGRTTDAIDAYEKSVKLRPDYIAALSNLGRLLELQGKTVEAINVLERALAIAPSSTEAIVNLSNTYLSAGKPQKTIDLLQSLITGDTEKSDASLALAFNSLGVANHILDNKNHAIRYFRKAIEKNPHFAEAHENLAQTLLFQGEYKKAWVEYEWRWQNQSNAQSKRRFNGVSWNGEKLLNKTLLVHAEQGSGDVIQFARFLSMIDIQDGKLILACDTPLIDLLSTLSSVDKVININEKLPAYDRHVPLLSLPRILGISETNIPSSPYLSAKPSHVIDDTDKIKIGITWAGKPRHQSDPYRNRSCSIDAFKPLLSISGIELYSLQTGPNKTELKKINEANSIKDLSNNIQSFEDTAALIYNLDLVITIDTAMAHLAGSLGKTVWILLAKSSDWRWNVKHEKKNIWYPTARIFKQKSEGNWFEPLDDLTRELKKLIPSIR